MKTTTNLQEFVENQELCYCVPVKDLPGWAADALSLIGCDALTVCHAGNGVELAVKNDSLLCRLLDYQTGDTADIQLAFADLKADLHTALQDMGNKIVIPDIFDFFLKDCDSLEVSRHVIMGRENEVVLENCFLAWTKPVVLLKDLLELDYLSLQFVRTGMFCENHLQGAFSVGKLKFILAFELTDDSRIMAELLPAEGTFPGFQEFLSWLTGESDGIKQMFSWMQADPEEFDAALAEAGITVDLSRQTVEEARVRVKLNLFGIPFDVNCYCCSKRLEAQIWNGTVLKFSDFTDRLGLQIRLPDYLDGIADLQISSCSMTAQLENQEYHFVVVIDNALEIGAFSVKSLEIHVIRQTAGTAFSVSGMLDLKTQISIGSIPLLQEVLPEKCSYTINNIRIDYEKGQIVGVNLLLAYNSSGAEKKRIRGKISEQPPETEEDLSPTAPVLYGAVCENQSARQEKIGRQFGPAYIDQFSFIFSEGKMLVRITGGLTMAGAGFTLRGLKVGYDLSEKKLIGGLDGIDIYVNTDSYALEGSMYCLYPEEGKDDPEYGGVVRLKMYRWMLSAMASYTKTESGETSLFVFVNCDAQLGGVPAFQITGIMGGLGINRRLLMPDISQMESFPLLQIDGKKKMNDVLTDLTTKGPDDNSVWLKTAKGEEWFALGVSFRSFGLVEGKMLLFVQTGEDLQITLIGRGDLTLPKGAVKDKAYAYIRLFLSAVLRPKEGNIMIRAALSDDSFLLSRDCRLSGEAAFAMWFGKNEHAGDFVLSIGGYHPAYACPKHYPVLNRLQFQWQVCRTISAKGQVYMAVAPACIMAGGNVRFQFQESFIKAWFEACFDLWMNWHPFYFQLGLNVEIGASVTLNLLVCRKTLTLSAGAQLQLWGPPVGGYAQVHLSVISFHISFGKKPEQTKAADWEEFAKLLPEKENMHRICAETGITQEQDQTWVVRTGRFSLTMESEIPAGEIGIRPMGKDKICSEYKVTIISPDGGSRDIVMNNEAVRLCMKEPQAVSAIPSLSNVPKALWGSTDADKNDADGLLHDRVSGCRIAASDAVYISGETRMVTKEDLIRKCMRDVPLDGEAEREEFLPDETSASMEQIRLLAGAEAVGAREELCRKLAGYYNGEPGTFVRLSGQLDTQFQDEPMLCGIKG